MGSLGWKSRSHLYLDLLVHFANAFVGSEREETPLLLHDLPNFVTPTVASMPISLLLIALYDCPILREKSLT